jgi:hypothetical protein
MYMIVYVYLVAYPYIQYMIVHVQKCLPIHRRMAYGNTMEIRNPSRTLGRAKVRVAANMF